MSEKHGFVEEFKKFITKGNVMDMAVGVIMGAAFTAIVNSMVKDILTPVLSLFLGKINFSDLKFVIKPAEGDLAEVAIAYGNFIQAVINFLLISLVIFFIVRWVNKIRTLAEVSKKKEAAAPVPAPAPAPDIVLLTEIRDLLKKQN